MRQLIWVWVALTAVSAAGADGETDPAQKHGEGCLALRSETDFQSPEGVWWGHRGRAFGNYLPFEEAALDEAAPEAGPRVLGVVYFDLDQSILTPEAKELCEQAYAYLKAHPGEDAHIQGYCCDLAPDAYNIRLGQRRAEAVKAYLTARGIDPDRITTRSYGEERLVPGTIPQDRELNRRAVILAIETAELQEEERSRPFDGGADDGTG